MQHLQQQTSTLYRGDNWIDIKAIKAKTKFGRTKIYAMVRDKVLPPPTKFGSASRWLECDVDQALRSHSPTP